MFIVWINVYAALLCMFPALGHLVAIETKIDLVNDPWDKFCGIFLGFFVYHCEFFLGECIWFDVGRQKFQYVSEQS